MEGRNCFYAFLNEWVTYCKVRCTVKKGIYLNDGLAGIKRKRTFSCLIWIYLFQKRDEMKLAGALYRFWFFRSLSFSFLFFLKDFEAWRNVFQIPRLMDVNYRKEKWEISVCGKSFECKNRDLIAKHRKRSFTNWSIKRFSIKIASSYNENLISHSISFSSESLREAGSI